MSGIQPGTKESTRHSNRWLLFLAVLGTALFLLFWRSAIPGHVLFANDIPLGAVKSQANSYPELFFGNWQDLSWIGGESVSSAPDISALVLLLFSPENYLKIFAPLTMLILGFSAWLFFRQLKFHPLVCLVGGLAAGLNMHFFSIACWGLGHWNLAVAMMFLALAALTTDTIKFAWAKAALAGMAVGVGLMEGFDVGAILSIYVGIFVLFVVWTQEGGVAGKIGKATWMGALVVIFSAFMAAHTISALVGTQITGISGTKQDTTTKQERWNPATQWSVPKLETLRVIIPGLFGYHMEGYIDSPDKSSAYWGRIGQDAAVIELQKAATSSDPKIREQAEKTLQNFQGYWRHSANGDYAGVLVAILALFGLANSFRGNNTPFSSNERKAVWFWGAAALISLLAAFGRYGFLYQFLYELPYFSTIRNPMKFMHPFHVAWLILAAYGLEALTRRYLNVATRTKLSDFEKKWTVASLATIGAAVVALFIFVSSKTEFEHHLQANAINASLAPQIAKFAAGEIAWFILFLILSAGVVIGILKGAFSGGRAKWAWIFMGVILFFDLGRSNQPWIKYFDYKEKYAMNPVVDFLRKNPYDQRVTAKLMPNGSYDLPADNNFSGLCYFWLQNDFPYHNIQSLDIIQMPRMPELDRNMLSTFRRKSSSDFFPCGRLWTLTNTRYILAAAQFLPLLNEQVDPVGHGFILRALFNIVPKPGLTHVEDAGDLTAELNNDKGPFAVIEFTNALPRAKLYSNWQTPTNDEAALAQLASTNFNPFQTVLVAKDTPVPDASKTAGNDAGTVTISQYLPKHLTLQAHANTPSILLLNDKFAPGWIVSVDGKAAPLLRCNYIMRGVFLEKGEHTIEFRFQPPLTTLYVSLGAWGAGLLIAGFLISSNAKSKKKPVEPPPQPATEKTAKTA